MPGGLLRALPVAQPVPKHQSSWRDIALVVRDDVAHDRLLATLAQDASALVRSVLLFDVYRPAQPGGDDHLRQAGASVSVSAPQPASQVSTSAPVRCRPVSR